jgi:hypothetical protein
MELLGVLLEGGKEVVVLVVVAGRNAVSQLMLQQRHAQEH